jgi:hypothetical protein
MGMCSRVLRLALSRTSSVRNVALLLLLLSLGWPFYAKAGPRKRSVSRETHSSNGYTGSKVCAECHRSIYNSFSRTDMGRSMSTVTLEYLAQLPASAVVSDPRQNRHFSVSAEHGQLYQTEWETGDDGKDVFRETEQIEWIMGAGENGIGALVRRGDQIFEAPLAYYTKTRTWALSPGYEDADRGFSRPIDASCIVCHSGRPNPVPDSPGQFRVPAFDELAIGCENCHGPGAAHVLEMDEGAPAAGAASSIVNPGKLSPWLSDNICMSCHQTGDARVLQPGKGFQDFRPGQPLDHTLALLMPPPNREAPPRPDVLQHYFSMELSKCYRSSGGKLSCTTCHDPHVQPSSDAAPAYYRGKCLGCHTESSCTAPAVARQQTVPADNCIGCHMPRRDVVTISHSSLTNHRIVATPDEPFPDITFRLTTPALPDLVHLDAIPGQPDVVPPLTLLQAYGQVGAEHREYLQRYFEVAKQLETSQPNETHVLEALAADALQQGSPEGDRAAVAYLSRAIELGSTTAWDFEELGTRFLRAHKLQEAASCLRTGIQRAPYDSTLYSLLAEGYVAMNRPSDAAAILTRALQLFPQIDLLRAFRQQVEETGH